MHALSHSRYERLVQHYKHVGLSSRLHGNKGRVPPNTLHFDDVTQLTTFIVNYARAHGMPLPGRVLGHRDKVMVLPSDITKAHVFTNYTDACSSNGWTAVGRTKFYDVWQNILPHISISKPSSDLCFTCQQNSLALQKSVCLPEEEKSRRLQVAQDHLYRAKSEREYYKAQVDTAVSAWSTRLCHYSYDFAQQIHYSYDVQQTGPEYFKTARKCGIFGVCNDGKNQQVNYLIDEAENPGKGANCVISLVHHYLGKYGHSEKAVYLHADNCTAQNKNNASIQYLMWRVMTMKNESIELSFMLTGHTKFSPDRFFGLLKNIFRRSSVSTLSDIELVMNRSTKADQNIPQRLHSIGGETLVTFYQWSEHLSQFFRSIPNILPYHNFRVTCQEPGIVYLREFSNSAEIQYDILKPDVRMEELHTLPNPTHIRGLDPQRQYLYEQIRPHCKSNLAADLTCPKPSMPKPSLSLSRNTDIQDTTENSSASTSSKRKRSCSICHNPGHTKRTCPSQ